MKKTILILSMPFILFAQSYMAKIEPYEKYTIYAQNSGQIKLLNKKNETNIINGVLISIDDSLEKQKLNIYKNQLILNEKKLNLLKENYNKFIKITGKSKNEKDDKYYEILTQKINMESLKLSIKDLEDSINKKTIKVKNLYIKEFLVNKGDYVSTGTKLATVYDIQKSKAIIYINQNDYKNILQKELFIDNKKNIAKIEKIDKTTDDTYISSYKITLVLEDKDFGKTIQVEFK